ncbi:MAG: NBR1-Ig-like domain-containing protein, partial [Anaerolineae bacterium]|nr:NBR1-Ig-like domain-containing protein [Anaerolineae bacterium]
MFSKETPMSDERAVEAEQQSQAAYGSSDVNTVGFFEPHQLTKLAQHGRLYVIADSIGGGASGQVAAEYAVKKILHDYYNDDTPDLEARLRTVIQQTNRDIYERNQEHPQRRLMGTTLMAALIHDNKLLVLNVGDNRVYVVWDQDIEWLNAPVKKAEEHKEPDGPILIPATSTPPDRKPDPPPPLKDRMPKALGLEETIEIDSVTRRLFAGDVVVLASGGLSGYVSESEMARAMTKHTPDQAIRRLMALAAERGNRSHIALSVTRVLSSPVAMRSPLPMVMPAPPTWSDWESAPKPGRGADGKTPTRPLSKPGPYTLPQSSPRSATAPMTATPASSAATGKMTSPTDTGPLPRNPLSTRPPSTEISLRPPRWNVRVLVGAFLLVLLCALPLLIWRYGLPPGSLASVPILGDLEASLFGPPPADSPADGEPVAFATEPGSPLPTPTPLAEAGAVEAAVAPTPVSSGSPVPTLSPVATTTTQAITADADTITLPSPTISPTPLPTIVVPANCENKARFVTDVTVDDGEQFPQARPFDKIWRVRNEGTCPWGPGYTIRFLNGDNFGVESRVPVTVETNPDETSDLTVPMIAPDEEGSYRGVWQLYDLNGQPFGPTMYLEIEVVAGAAGPAAGPIDSSGAETLFDFVANAESAEWSSGQVQYEVQATAISDSLELPETGGLVASGIGL